MVDISELTQGEYSILLLFNEEGPKDMRGIVTGLFGRNYSAVYPGVRNRTERLVERGFVEKRGKEYYIEPKTAEDLFGKKEVVI